MGTREWSTMPLLMLVDGPTETRSRRSSPSALDDLGVSATVTTRDDADASGCSTRTSTTTNVLERVVAARPVRRRARCVQPDHADRRGSTPRDRHRDGARRTPAATRHPPHVHRSPRRRPGHDRRHRRRHVHRRHGFATCWSRFLRSPITSHPSSRRLPPGAVLGLDAAVAASAVPVWQAVRVEPIEAIRTGHLVGRVRPARPWTGGFDYPVRLCHRCRCATCCGYRGASRSPQSASVLRSPPWWPSWRCSTASVEPSTGETTSSPRATPTGSSSTRHLLPDRLTRDCRDRVGVGDRYR